MTPSDNQDDNKMMAYFMGQTNERLAKIEEKLVELLTFRAEVLASARATSIIVGAVWAVIIIVLNVLLRKMGF